MQIKTAMPGESDIAAMETSPLTIKTMDPLRLAASDLRRSCNPQELGFATTVELQTSIAYPDRNVRSRRCGSACGCARTGTTSSLWGPRGSVCTPS
jgi:hypothetical protein